MERLRPGAVKITCYDTISSWKKEMVSTVHVLNHYVKLPKLLVLSSSFSKLL
jgi:hypothetical protein